jgi:hypothetical protein
MAAVAMLATPVSAQDGKTPAGYVVASRWRAATRRRSCATAGAGPKLMMPLYAGDIVFVRDPASRIDLEIGGRGAVELRPLRGRGESTGDACR